MMCLNGVLGKSFPADSTLNGMKKSELIKLLHLAKDNYEALLHFYNATVNNSKCSICPLEHKLKNYEDAEKEGKLLRVPYLINDTVYIIKDSYFDDYECEEEAKHKGRYFIHESYLSARVQGACYFLEQLGDTYFFDRKIAEARVRGLNKREWLRQC